MTINSNDYSNPADLQSIINFYGLTGTPQQIADNVNALVAAGVLKSSALTGAQGLGLPAPQPTPYSPATTTLATQGAPAQPVLMTTGGWPSQTTGDNTQAAPNANPTNNNAIPGSAVSAAVGGGGFLNNVTSQSLSPAPAYVNMPSGTGTGSGGVTPDWINATPPAKGQPPSMDYVFQQMVYKNIAGGSHLDTAIQQVVDQVNQAYPNANFKAPALPTDARGQFQYQVLYNMATGGSHPDTARQQALETMRTGQSSAGLSVKADPTFTPDANATATLPASTPGHDSGNAVSNFIGKTGEIIGNASTAGMLNPEGTGTLQVGGNTLSNVLGNPTLQIEADVGAFILSGGNPLAVGATQAAMTAGADSATGNYGNVPQAAGQAAGIASLANITGKGYNNITGGGTGAGIVSVANPDGSTSYVPANSPQGQAALSDGSGTVISGSGGSAGNGGGMVSVANPDGSISQVPANSPAGQQALNDGSGTLITTGGTLGGAATPNQQTALTNAGAPPVDSPGFLTWATSPQGIATLASMGLTFYNGQLMSNAIAQAAAGQTQAANAALAQQQRQFNAIYGNIDPRTGRSTGGVLSPAITQGQNAITALGDRYNPASPDYKPPPSLSLPDQTTFAQNIAKDPGYQFQLQRGEEALNASRAATGGYFSGETGVELEKLGQGLAASNWEQYYQNATNNALMQYNAAMQGYTTPINTLQSMSGTGMQATGQLSNAAMQNSANTTNLLTGIAGVNAAANVANAQTQASMYNGILNTGISALGSYNAQQNALNNPLMQAQANYYNALAGSYGG